MGRIKTTLIKRSGRKLLANYRDEFGTDFTKNKIAVRKGAEVTSKKLRNSLAGYITRVAKRLQSKTK